MQETDFLNYNGCILFCGVILIRCRYDTNSDIYHACDVLFLLSSWTGIEWRRKIPMKMRGRASS